MERDSGEGPSDRELCERCREGRAGRDAFAVLVARYQPAVSRFVARSLKGREEGEDVVQETFIRAYQQIQRFRPETNFLAWVLTIARFLCMARRKDAQRHPPPASLEPTLEPAGPAPEPLPESLERLKKACESLPHHQREIVAMRFTDGLDYRAIAEVTGENEATLRSRLHDAILRLKQVLGARASAE